MKKPRKPLPDKLAELWEKKLEKSGLGVINLLYSKRDQHAGIIDGHRQDKSVAQRQDTYNPVSILDNATRDVSGTARFEYWYSWTHSANALPIGFPGRKMLIHMGDTGVMTESARACKVPVESARTYVKMFEEWRRERAQA